MSRAARAWAGRIVGVFAVLAVGVLSGWIFRPGTAETSDHPAETAHRPAVTSDRPNESSERPTSERTAATPGGPAKTPARTAEPPQEPVEPTRENRLARETSPYLRLHKNNPIDWYPWGPEALEKARREGKLIFLSIGYSSCYWCHVMERESFNDPEIAAAFNQSFVCIKVDREELPDVDEVFMTFVQLSNRGRGGWPLSVFLTPDAKPIVGGTYFPPRQRDAMPGLLELVQAVQTAWRDERASLEAQADRWTRDLQAGSKPRGFSFRAMDQRMLDEAIRELANEFDPQFGGFGYVPGAQRQMKFPQPCILELLCWRLGQARDEQVGAMLMLTLHRLNQGGIWDSIGGGFHRYSVDREWRIPHFEKMLYDNALLARVYLEAFSLTNDRVFRHMAVRIFQFVANELTSPEGGFYSALDAESEHEEGRYYVWSKQEVQQLLDPAEYQVVSQVQMRDANRVGEELYVLQLGDSLPAISRATRIHEGDLAGVLERSAQKLLAARSTRVRPLLDTKILTDWNGLMIAALADGHRILGDETYRMAAERAAELLLKKSRTADDRLAHAYTAGSAKVPAYLEDYAYLADGLVALHRSTGDERWLAESKKLVDEMNQLFWDESDGGYFRTAADRDVVVTRVKTTEDGATPSGNSTAALALVRLAKATGDSSYADRAGRTLAAFAGPVTRSPSRWPRMVRALSEYLDASFAADSLAPPAGVEREVVRAMAVVRNERIQVGGTLQIDVPLEIDRQWHIYANPSSSPQFPPTTLRVFTDLPLRDVTVQYPPSRIYQPEGTTEPIAVYSERSRIRVTAQVDPAAATGRTEIQLALQYQACNDERCMAPRTIRLPISVEIVPAPPERERPAQDPESP